jgi:ADP-L-glycero-D-manno-heptose 6-epimerase
MHIVTGGAGFIGSNLVRALNQRGIDDVLVVDDLERGDKHLNLNGLAFQDFVDYRDFAAQRARFGKPVAVLHQGACSDTTEQNGRFMMAVNYESSKELAEWCLAQGVPFIYASSAATYGDGKRGFREEAECEWPLNVYGFSKQLFDRWVRRQLARARSQLVGVRYFNVYGPQENHKERMASVVFKFHQQASADGKLRIFAGSDKFLRDFVYVDDAVAVNLHFLDHPERSGIFNCGSGRAESFQKLCEAALAHYPGASIEYLPFPPDLVGKYQDYTCADLSRLRAAGFEREMTSLERGVAEYVRILKRTGGYHRPDAGPAAR